MSRPTKQEAYVEQTRAIALRATCNRGKSGAMFVNDREKILGHGYVGSAPGEDHCDDVGHEWEFRLRNPESWGKESYEPDEMSQHCVRTIHAEMNAVLSVAAEVLAGSTLYTTMVPCWNCAKHLARLKLKEIVALNAYHSASTERTIKLFDGYGVPVKILSQDPLYESKTY